MALLTRKQPGPSRADETSGGCELGAGAAPPTPAAPFGAFVPPGHQFLRMALDSF